jgi:hypothetical protein
MTFLELFRDGEVAYGAITGFTATKVDVCCWLRRIKKTGSDLARTVLGEPKLVPGGKA